MFVVEKSQLNEFEHDLTRTIFLEEYSNLYEIDKDEWMLDEKCILAKRVIDNKKVVIKLFQRFNNVELKKYAGKKIMISYYVKNNESNTDDIYETKKLSDKFLNDLKKFKIHFYLNGNIDELIKRDLTMIYLNKYVYEVNKFNYDLNRLFGQLYLYKYYSDESDRIKNKLQGEITFSAPSTFNDPFDCDCIYNADDLKKKVDVLCMTDDNKNILMWSYYGNDHKGYCIKYDVMEILSELSKKYKGVVIIGKIKYDTSRPKYVNKKLSSSSLSMFRHLIDCMFTKYDKWIHENEYRCIIMPVDTNREYYNINIGNISTNCIYRGCNCNSVRVGETLIIKDDVLYELL